MKFVGFVVPSIVFKPRTYEFLKKMKEDYDRLFEISPICSRRFILAVKRRVRKHATDRFQVPPYMNGFKHTNVWNNDQDEEDEESFQSNRSHGEERKLQHIV